MMDFDSSVKNSFIGLKAWRAPTLKELQVTN